VIRIFRPPYPYIHLQNKAIRRIFLAAVAAIEASVTFGLNTTHGINNTKDVPVSLNLSIDLDKVNSEQLTAIESVIFSIVLDQNQIYSSIVEGFLTLSVTLDQNQLVNLLAQLDISFDTTLTLNIINQLLTNKSINFPVNLLFELVEQGLIVGEVTFATDLSLSILNKLNAVSEVNFQVDLATDILNKIIINETVNFNIDLVFNILNQLQALKNVEFSTILNFNILNTISKNVNISLDVLLDIAQFADGAGEISAFITFALATNQIQTNTIIANKAFELIVNMAESINVSIDRSALLSLLIQVSDEYTNYRKISADAEFALSLSKTETNTAIKIATLTFSALMNKTLTTQLDYNLIVNLATTLATQFSTDGEIFASILFGLDADQQQIQTKTTAEAITLALQTTYETDIHLVATGEISFTTQVEQVLVNQLTGQTEITFGHLLGLSSIGSADLGESITFSTIQDVQINGFVLQFTIVTPRNRTLKVFIEDRTTIVDELERVITVGKIGIL